MKKKSVKSKAEAIRTVSKNDLSISNSQMKQLVKDRYGFEVSSSEIINQIGSYAERKHRGQTGRICINLAREFVAKIGDLREAVRLLHLSQAK